MIPLCSLSSQDQQPIYFAITFGAFGHEQVEVRAVALVENEYRPAAVGWFQFPRSVGSGLVAKGSAPEPRSTIHVGNVQDDVGKGQHGLSMPVLRRRPRSEAGESRRTTRLRCGRRWRVDDNGAAGEPSELRFTRRRRSCNSGAMALFRVDGVHRRRPQFV